MISFVTVWVMTVTGSIDGYREVGGYSYQLTYSTQSICSKQIKNHTRKGVDTKTARCDFQQIPVVVSK